MRLFCTPWAWQAISQKRTFTMSMKDIDNAVAALTQRIHVPSQNVREQKRWLLARDKLCTKCGETDNI
jgi:hypothetical protein